MALEQPFQPGDWIKVSDFDEGEVVDISWRTTKILTKDNSILSFPNSTVSEGQIKNYNSPTSVTRQTILVKIDPLHRPKDVEKILLDACLACSNTLLSDEPYAKLHHIDDWFAQYKLSYSISDFQNRGIIKQEVWKNVWTHLDYANVMFATHPLHQKSSGASRNLLNVDALALRVIKHSDLFGRLTDDQQNQLIKKPSL